LCTQQRWPRVCGHTSSIACQKPSALRAKDLARSRHANRKKLPLPHPAQDQPHDGRAVKEGLFYVRRHTCADGSFEWYVLFPQALRRLKKISGASRRGSLTFCNNFAVCSFSAKT
jgi:hypothetical protein